MSHLIQVSQSLGNPNSFSTLIAALSPIIESHGFAINSLIMQWVMGTPAQITADQNNYALPDEAIVRLSSDASRTITGFSPAEEGHFHILINVGAEDIVIANLDGGSIAANQVITLSGAGVTLGPNGTFIMVYDVVSSKWRQVL